MSRILGFLNGLRGSFLRREFLVGVNERQQPLARLRIAVIDGRTEILETSVMLL
ncbi:MAG TPA: hypothetical protein VFI31_22490 [Pirellulales bacterium]|nr:hypothetical protein [Pirellulales bacterium]